MERNYEKDYSTITGLTDFGKYTTPENEASKIEKCSILLPVNITFSDRVIEYKNNQQ